MPGARRLRLLELLAADGSDEESRRLCEVAAEATNVTGAGVMLMAGDVPAGSLCCTDHRSELIEELQFSLGEGPCVDAFHQGRPVLEPDLASTSAVRWPGFTRGALEAGVGAVFGFPLCMGEVRLGALNLYRVGPGPLGDEEHADALVMAEIVTGAILVMQAGAPTGGLAVELQGSGDLRLVVHQATGMVAAQLGVGVAQALVRLRASAFGDGRTLREVAEDVVARRIRFDGQSGDAGPVPWGTPPFNSER